METTTPTTRPYLGMSFEEIAQQAAIEHAGNPIQVYSAIRSAIVIATGLDEARLVFEELDPEPDLLLEGLKVIVESKNYDVRTLYTMTPFTDQKVTLAFGCDTQQLDVVMILAVTDETGTVVIFHGTNMDISEITKKLAMTLRPPKE